MRHARADLTHSDHHLNRFVDKSIKRTVSIQPSPLRRSPRAARRCRHWVGDVEAYPPPVSAHVDDGDSVDPSRTVDTHLVAGSVTGDRGSQGRVERDPLAGDVW